jgi:hypothetical protein
VRSFGCVSASRRAGILRFAQNDTSKAIARTAGTLHKRAAEILLSKGVILSEAKDLLFARVEK